MDFDPRWNLCRSQKIFRSAINQIFRITRQCFIAARKLNSISTTLKSQFVAEIDRLKNGFEFVKAISAFAEDVQQQVDFAMRFLFERHGVVV
jgi:hypothetical protein